MKKGLLIHSCAKHSIVIEVAADDKMSYVRAEALKKFGNDRLPGKSDDVVIKVGKIQLSRREEESMLAWSVIQSKRIVELCTPSNSGVPEVNEAQRPLKKQRNDDQVEKKENGDNKSHTEDLDLKHEKVLFQSREHLQGLKELLQHNTDFCADARRQEWVKEIDTLTKKSAPETIIGCLGGTGVGKSSLLNALCDEAAILPTSGSRGCTATVVELRFNKDLLNPSDKTTVYKGQVEFMSLQEWYDELKVLVDLCCVPATQKILTAPPDDRQNPEIAAAWSKLKAVYGRKTMSSCLGRPRADVWEQLSQDNHVVKLLSGENGHANTIVVEEGCADAAQAKLLLGRVSSLDSKLRKSKKTWAKKFRSKINEFVYRSGKAGDPQSWPLTRKVVLHGPWAVLSTGARLVDLPGVRDANAARAAVASSYLQHCHKIWIVAPIKRAVDDGTAKELLGEQFKRRLLMDGKYGAVSFICTKTDDCEASEVEQDHEDIARSLGLWEQLVSLPKQIETLEDVIKDLEEGGSDTDDDDCSENGKENQGEQNVHTSKLHNKKSTLQTLKEQKRRLQRNLKALSALVRNEYSTKRLQQDFRAGLEDMTRKDDEEMDDTVPATDMEERILPPLPEDFQLDVYCISANDYLKLEKVKSDSDGAAQAFERVEDTQIPRLRTAVHEATSESNVCFASNFAIAASEILDRVNLCATENREVSAFSDRFRGAFDKETASLESRMAPIASEFTQKIEGKISNTLQPSFKQGANAAKTAAMATATSWGSYARRTKHARAPDQNGLHWCTYEATMVRKGVHKSKAAGQIDLNQELCDPMEKEFSSDWRLTMDGAIRLYLVEAEQQVVAMVDETSQAIVAALKESGMESERLKVLANAAQRASTQATKRAFQSIRDTASQSQRSLHRSLCPKIADIMNPGYRFAYSVQRGKGTFIRMKESIGKHVRKVEESMFEDAASQLLQAIDLFIKDIASMILTSSQAIQKSLTNVYSVSWDDGQQDRVDKATPFRRQQILDCRMSLLPDINRLRQAQDELTGVERKDLESEVIGVDNWEQRKAKEMKQAQERGDYFDLVDSDDDDDEESVAPAKMPPIAMVAVKSEPSEPTAAGTKKSQKLQPRAPLPGQQPTSHTSRHAAAGHSWAPLFRGLQQTHPSASGMQSGNPAFQQARNGAAAANQSGWI